ncbi:hypothetical protein [uncultured Microbacterium sp.]|uniref:hypothetical protein n=1 Tax=uncultured Microbacterium sp. TaxID=191216 RepID=UPI0025CFA644|nr:hypothetical protein [uncultured Microbacterium sp.]
MTTTITAGTATITPLLVEGYTAARDGGALVHRILGSSAPDVTLRPAGMRTGSLVLLFDVEGTARAAWTALSGAVVAVLTDTDRAIGMSFVVPDGQPLSLALDDVTRRHWHLTVPFQEVSA